MDLTVKGYFRNYLKLYKKHIKDLSLDDVQYSKDRGNKNAKSMIKSVTYPYSLDKNLDTLSFSSNMSQVLSALSQEDFLFVILKFQEDYTEYELANYFKITIDEVKEKEFRILSLLRKNPNILKLKKIK